MKFRGYLIVTEDNQRARKFYEDLFNLRMIVDYDGNMELENGIFLQERKYWEKFLGNKSVSYSNSSELYFIEDNIEEFINKLETLYPNVKFVNKLITHAWGQKVCRFYDLDGNLIEVGTSF